METLQHHSSSRSTLRVSYVSLLLQCDRLGTTTYSANYIKYNWHNTVHGTYEISECKELKRV